ncbi:zinc finger protein 716-like [Micropterus dolomieu]|uniref:zinc finger protein 716-like n=1 Tax=Micropterus dolomieu TaxID=147949 RepID=UPI001E8E5193|nr:zinc finger protein 716-like [Micropterus dolomieu]
MAAAASKRMSVRQRVPAKSDRDRTSQEVSTGKQRGRDGLKQHHCDKSFRTSGQSKNHRRVHTGEKPYSCDQCGKVFSTLSNLKSHKYVHMGEKAYRCEQRGKTFTHSKTLKRHQCGHAASL